MSSRRSHKKSRNGCKECKRRHIKCNERNPCSNCSKHSIPCSYIAQEKTKETSCLSRGLSPSDRQTSAPLLHGDHSSPSMVSSSQSHDTSQHPQKDDANFFQILTNHTRNVASASRNFSARDIQLMHHYSTLTYATLSRKADMQRIWQVVIPQEGYAHEFLMRGILAVSALHIAHLSPEKSSIFSEISSYHQDIALKEFRATLSNITTHNRVAVFAFATLLIPYICALPTRSGIGCLPQAIDNAVDLIVVTRGIDNIIRDDAWLHDSALAPLARGHWTSDDRNSHEVSVPISRVPYDMLLHLANLRLFIEEQTLDMEQRDKFLVSLTGLETTVTQMRETGPDLEFGTVFIWAFALPKDFIYFLQCRHPVALVILAHYCVLLHCTEDAWYLEYWAGPLLTEIDHLLATNWKQWIEWPKRFVFG